MYVPHVKISNGDGLPLFMANLSRSSTSWQVMSNSLISYRWLGCESLMLSVSSSAGEHTSTRGKVVGSNPTYDRDLPPIMAPAESCAYDHQ